MLSFRGREHAVLYQAMCCIFDKKKEQNGIEVTPVMTHKTKGIVLRTLKYGETSLITTIYNELFGIQSYIVKGVRQGTKKSSAKGVYFQPAAILDLVVYQNEFKNLNFIKEYGWAYLYQEVLSNVL